MTQLLKYIESQYTGEVRLKPELVSFETNTDEIRLPYTMHVHRAILRLSLQYHWPVNVPPPNLPDYITQKFAREIYGELEPDLHELYFHLMEMRNMGAPVEAALHRVERLLNLVQGKD